jgi:hypothetical protein
MSVPGTGTVKLSEVYTAMGAPTGTGLVQFKKGGPYVANNISANANVASTNINMVSLRGAQSILFGIPITSGLVGAYLGESFSNNQWYDVSGNGNNTVSANGTVTVNVDSLNGKTYLSGTTATNITFPSTILPATYTLFHVTRYANTTNRGRIITSASTNWLSGFWGSLSGVAYHNAWVTGSTQDWSTVVGGATSTQGQTWLLSTDQSSLYRANGVTIGTGASGSASPLGINTNTGETSDWMCACVLVFNSALSAVQYQQIETWLMSRYNISPPALILTAASGTINWTALTTTAQTVLAPTVSNYIAGSTLSFAVSGTGSSYVSGLNTATGAFTYTPAYRGVSYNVTLTVTATYTNGITQPSGSITFSFTETTSIAPAGIYPPVAMTNNSTVMSNGTYIASASSQSSGWIAYRAFDKVLGNHHYLRNSTPPYGWASLGYGSYSTDFNNTTTTYYAASVNEGYLPSGIAASTTVSGVVYKGEWIQIQLPQAITLGSFTYYNTEGLRYNGMVHWVMAGSTDGITWVLLDLHTRTSGGTNYGGTYNSATDTYTNGNNTYRLDTSTMIIHMNDMVTVTQGLGAFSYFRLICLKITSGYFWGCDQLILNAI